MEKPEYTGNYQLDDKDAWAAVADRLKDKTPGMHGRVVLFCDPISTDGASKIPGYENVLFHAGNHDPESSFGLIKLQGRSTGRQEEFRKSVEHYSKYYSKIKIINLHMEKNETNIPKGSYQIRPNHYGGADNPLEARKIIDHYGLGFNLGNVVKYVLRCGKKDSKIQELRKAMTYLEFEIEKELADVDTVPMTPEKLVNAKSFFDSKELERIHSYATRSIKALGHEESIIQIEKGISNLKEKTPLNYHSIAWLTEALRLTKESFERYKAQFEEYNEKYNLSSKPIVSTHDRDKEIENTEGSV